MLRVRWVYAVTFYKARATLADLRVAVNTLEETERIARRRGMRIRPRREQARESRGRSRASAAGLGPTSEPPQPR